MRMIKRFASRFDDQHDDAHRRHQAERGNDHYLEHNFLFRFSYDLDSSGVPGRRAAEGCDLLGLPTLD